MKILSAWAVALLASASAFAQTGIPAAPALTAGAEFKGLRFDWNTVPGAAWYQLEYRAHQTGSFVQQGDDFPATATSTRFTFPLHLFDWTYARYRLAACNSAGCSRSAEVSVSDLRRDAVGYFKSSQPEGYGNFGDAVDLSPDGYNFVATAPSESTTISGDYSDGGAAYVFRRGSDGKWVQRARLELHDHVNQMDIPYINVAISGTGNTVAVGMPTLSGDGASGQVDIFYSKAGNYSRTRIPRSVAGPFGTAVALSESGYVLAIGADDEQTSVAIYKSVNGVWQNVRNLPGWKAGTGEICYMPQLSRDGTTIAERCDQFQSPTQPRRSFVRVHSGNNWSVRTDIDLWTSANGEVLFNHRGFAIDRTGGTIAVQFYKVDVGTANGTAEVRVFKRGTGGYSQVATLTPGAWRTNPYGYEYGATLSLSGDGHTLAVGDGYDNGTSWGPRAAPLVSGTARTGAVYVYRLTDSWKLANMVKPNYRPDPGQADFFGTRLALSQTGKTLVVAVPQENSSATGIDGNWANSDRDYSGAIFMY